MLEQQQKLENNKIDIPYEYLCPISLGIMKDPVIAEDGHSYERSEITLWFTRNLSSPKTGEKLSSNYLISNHNLRNTIQDFIKKSNDEIQARSNTFKKKTPVQIKKVVPESDLAYAGKVFFEDVDTFAMDTRLNISDLEYQREQLLDWNQLKEAKIESLHKRLNQQEVDNLKLRSPVTKGLVTDSNLNENEKNLKQINQKLEKEPYNARLLNLKATLLRDLNRKEEALIVLNEAISRFPRNEFLLTTRGAILKNCGFLQEALNDFKKVIEINSNNTHAISGKNSTQHMLNEHKTDKGSSKKVIERFMLESAKKDLQSIGRSETAKDLYTKAMIQKQSGRFNEALDILNDALIKYPKNCYLLCNRGDLMNKMGNYQQALKDFDLVLNLSPNLDPQHEFAQKGKALATRKISKASFSPVLSAPKKKSVQQPKQASKSIQPKTPVKENVSRNLSPK